MKKEDLHILSETISSGSENKTNPIWIAAFNEFNSDKGCNLSMDINFHYEKVLCYLFSKLTQ